MPRFAPRPRALPLRRLPFGVRRWAVHVLPRRRGGRAHAAPRRSALWLRLLAGVVVMAVLFAVLLSAAQSAPVTVAAAAAT